MFKSLKRTLGLLAVAALGATTTPALAVDATVDAATQYQTIHGFGACLYNPNMGSSTSVYTNNTLKSLYAQDLGCSILRVSIEPHILMTGDLTGPEVSLGSDLNSNAAKFNWEQDRHRYYDDWIEYLAANALETSRVKIFGAIWSPPHWAKQATGATVNGQPTPAILYCNTCDTAGGTWRDGYFQYNARFISGAVKSLENATGGIPLYALSIQNEAIYEMPFNSCTLAPSNTWSRYATALKAVKDEWTTHGLTTRIMGPHHANIGYYPGDPHGLWVMTNMINAVKNHSDTGLKNFWQIYTHNYGANKDAQARMYHAYQIGSNNVPGTWASWAGTVGGIQADGKETWNSEAGGHAATFDGAMDLAHDANNQMVWANESVWAYWQFCDGGSLSEHNLLGADQISNPHSSKKYCAFKHFSRYIRPGSKRVKFTFSNATPTWGGVDQYDTQNSLIGSAYVHSGDGRVTMVLVNMGTGSQSLAITVPTSPNVTSYEQYRTSSTESFAKLSNLSVSSGRVSFTIPGRSIVTLTGTGSTGGGTLPSGWTAADIGSPSPAGSTSHSSGTWTVNGGGADIWGSSDQFHYAYRDASGDTTVVARVDSLTNTNSWAKAGVMIRNGTAANAQFAMAVVTPTNGVRFQWRASTGGSAADVGVTGAAPKWVRVVRSGNNFTASWSDNGTSWNTIGTAQSIAMPTATKAGLAVTSHANGTLCTATISNVSVTTGGGSTPGGSGTISREVWTGITGNDVNLIPLSSAPSSTGTLTSFEAPTNVGDSYGQRVRGYLTAPQTGSYTFWIASDDDSELWLSTNDQAGSKVRIAYIDGWTNSREWGKYASQKSASISLTAGNRYYIEALMKEGAGGDNLAVGWAKPGQSTTAPSEVIPGAQLSPWDGGSTPASLFANHGFESDLTSWTNTGNSAITSDAASGTKAVVTGTGQGGVQQEVAYTSGGTLNINVKAKISGTISSWCGIGIDFLDSAGTEISETTFQVTATSYTAWSNASVTVPSGTARLRFWTWKPGTSGSLFVDDVVVNRN